MAYDIMVQWIKCPLVDADLTNVTGKGVYIIFHSPSGKVVRVGHGPIADRLCADRNNPEVLDHVGDGELLATWAEIENEALLLGVEAFLVEKYPSPLVSGFYAKVAPISVNLPV